MPQEAEFAATKQICAWIGRQIHLRRSLMAIVRSSYCPFPLRNGAGICFVVALSDRLTIWIVETLTVA